MELRSLPRVNYKETRKYTRRAPVVSRTAPATADMTSQKVFGQLSGVLFQIGELLEDFEEDEIEYLGVDKLQNSYEELKSLRIDLVSLNSELVLLQGTDYKDETGKTVNGKLSQSKLVLKKIEDAVAKTVKEGDARVEEQKAAEISGRTFAYQKVLKEAVDLINHLVKKCDTSKDETLLTKDVVLTRKEMEDSYALNFERAKVLVDRLLDYTDVIVEGKELVINAQILKLSGLNSSKAAFEEKLVQDLDKYD